MKMSKLPMLKNPSAITGEIQCTLHWDVQPNQNSLFAVSKWANAAGNGCRSYEIGSRGAPTIAMISRISGVKPDEFFSASI